MPTFVFNNNAASNSGVILLEVPDLAWFNDSVLSALAEMTLPNNWRGDDEDYRKYALLQANLMMATYKVLNFNPFPVGMLVPYSSAVTPPGYLPCDNSEYSITAYPELFAVIGYTYGGADDVFNTPYLQEAVLLDKGDIYAVGEYGGNSSIGITVPQLPAHTHNDPGHTHTIPLTSTTLFVAPGEVPGSIPVAFFTDNTGSTSVSLDNTGGNEQIDIRPFFMAVHYMIYAGR